MPATEMIVAVAMVGGISILIIAILGLIKTMMLHRTIRKALETNPDLAPGLLDKISTPPKSGGDDRLPIVLVAIGLAIAIAPFIAVDDPGLVRAALGAALFPLLVGGALWLRLRAAQRAKQRDGE